MNKPTFLARSHTKSKQSNVDAIKLINYILSLDKDNRIVKNGKLYKLATNQYNESIKNTLIRPEIPTWFCGKVDPNNGLLLTTETDEEQRVKSGLSTPEPTIPLTVTGFGLPYPKDNCLPGGTPASPGYNDCELNTIEDFDVGINLGDIDWANEVYSVAPPPELPPDVRDAADEPEIPDWLDHIAGSLIGLTVAGPWGALIGGLQGSQHIRNLVRNIF